MSDKEIALELLKVLIENKGIAYPDSNEKIAEETSEMYEMIYNKVHSLEK